MHKTRRDAQAPWSGGLNLYQVPRVQLPSYPDGQPTGMQTSWFSFPVPTPSAKHGRTNTCRWWDINDICPRQEAWGALEENSLQRKSPANCCLAQDILLEMMLKLPVHSLVYKVIFYPISFACHNSPRKQVWLLPFHSWERRDQGISVNLHGSCEEQRGSNLGTPPQLLHLRQGDCHMV